MHMKTAAQLVAAAKGRIENLTPDEVEAELAAEGVTLVDIREASEQQQSGRIPGAIDAPRGMLEFYADPSSPYHRPEFQPKQRIILHCASGGRSALAADTLQEMGTPGFGHLAGGFKAWEAAGKSVAKPQA